MSFPHCQFGDSKSFLHISSDNRIHLWDIESKKEKISYIDKNHLSHKFSCFYWTQNTSNNDGSSSSIASSILSVGYSDGIIITWDLIRGIVTKSLGSVGDPCPSGVTHSKNRKSIFVSSSSTNVITKHALVPSEAAGSLSAGKKGVSKIAINPKLDVLAASW